MLLLQLLQELITVILMSIVRIVQHSVVSCEKGAAINILRRDWFVFIRLLLLSLVAVIIFINLVLFEILKVRSVLFLLLVSACILYMRRINNFD